MQFRNGPQTFICPRCGEERTGVRRRCYTCTGTVLSPDAREKIRCALIGVPHTEERRQKNSEGHKGAVNRFNLGAFTAGKPSPRRKPVGATRVGNGHIQIKCVDGKWRYRARVMWEEANGPIPRGYLIHHVNEDPFDDRLDNFQLVTRAEHARIHATPERQRAAQALTVAARKRNRTY